MSGEIASIMTELKDLTNEIKKRSLELSKLRKRREELEEKMCKFLEDKGQPGIRHKGLAVIAQDKEKRLPKKKKDKKEDAVSILKKNGIVNNPETVYEQLIESMKGDMVNKKKVIVTTIQEKGIYNPIPNKK